MPGEAENTKTEVKSGKDILLSLLKNSFASSLSLLEKRTEEQMTSLTFTSKTFADFTSHLDNLAKQVEETRLKKEKEEKEKEAKREKEKEKSGGAMKRSKTVGKLSTKKTNTSVLSSKNNIKTSTNGKTSTSKPKNKTVSNFKPEEDGKKKTLVKSKTLKTLKSKKTDLSVDKSLNQSSSSIRKKSGTSVGKKKVVKESIKNISIKKEVEKSEKEDAKKEEKKEEVKEEPKKEEPPKEKPIERKPIEFYINTYSKEKWFDNIIAYMNSSDTLSFVSSTKLFKEQYQKMVKDYETSLKEILDLHEGQTVDNKIEEFNIKYKSDEDPSKPYPEFQLTKGALRAIELLNNDKYNQLFKKNILDPNLKEIVVIYRILFRLLNEKTICSIEDDSEFWIKVCDFFNEKGIDKLGTFLVDSTKKFNFENNNVYLINKLIIKKKAKMLPSYYSKICSSTGLIMFLIKDALEYCGIIFSEKKTPHNRVVNTLLYEKKLLEKINHLKEIVDKI